VRLAGPKNHISPLFLSLSLSKKTLAVFSSLLGVGRAANLCFLLAIPSSSCTHLHQGKYFSSSSSFFFNNLGFYLGFSLGFFIVDFESMEVYVT